MPDQGVPNGGVAPLPKARPVIGGVLGIVIGLAVAVLLQQQGIWPLDPITVFLIPAVLGGLGVLLTKIGREAAPAATIVMLVVLVAMAAWGATGFADIDEQGVLNGGCTVVAQSAIDTTTVTDSSRSNPFEIDPHGGLMWAATSPEPFMDYDWEIWVEIGGFPVTLDSGHELNDDGSLVNAGDVPDITAYAEERGIPIDEMRGVYKVGGSAATCDGFGFVEIVSEPLETLTAKIAAGVGLLAVVLLMMAVFMGRNPDPGPGDSLS